MDHGFHGKLLNNQRVVHVQTNIAIENGHL